MHQIKDGSSLSFGNDIAVAVATVLLIYFSRQMKKVENAKGWLVVGIKADCLTNDLGL